MLNSLKDNDPDQITAWMVSYLSKQMVEAEGGNKESITNCVNVIIKLWHNRTALPNGTRPFESFEPIFRALESLDPESAIPRYVLNFYDQDQRQNTEVPSSWLEMIKALDKTTRTLITFMFEQAINDATDDKTLDWIRTISRTVESDEVSFISRHLDRKEPSEELQRIKNLEKRIEQLKVFEDICKPIQKSLKEELHTLKERCSS